MESTEGGGAPGAAIRITQVRSSIGRTPTHRRTVRALGLRRVGHSVVQPDNAAIRGMVNQVGYLLKVEPAPATAAGGSSDGGTEK